MGTCCPQIAALGLKMLGNFSLSLSRLLMKGLPSSESCRNPQNSLPALINWFENLLNGFIQTSTHSFSLLMGIPRKSWSKQSLVSLSLLGTWEIEERGSYQLRVKPWLIKPGLSVSPTAAEFWSGFLGISLGQAGRRKSSWVSPARPSTLSCLRTSLTFLSWAVPLTSVGQNNELKVKTVLELVLW